MQTNSSVLQKNIRRAAMFAGLLFFTLFIYKASMDVSNPKIAAGVQHHAQKVSALSAQNTGITLGNTSIQQSAQSILPSPVTPKTNTSTTQETASENAVKYRGITIDMTEKISSKRQDTIKGSADTKNPKIEKVN